MFWHRYQYTSSLKPLEIQSRLDALLEVERENTLWTHLSEVRNASAEAVQGKRTEQGLTFWRTNFVWNGSFYPVFQLDWQEKADQIQVSVRTRFNAVAESVVVIIMLGFLVWVFDFVLDWNITPSQMLARLGMVVVVFFIFMAIPLYSYHSLRRQSLKGLEEYLELER